MNALLITDDIQDEVFLSHSLRLAGMIVDTAHQLAAPLERWSEKSADLLLVALRLPDPLRTVREIRGVAIVPLVLIVDSVTEDQHLALLEAGADWVIERPYSVRLLIGYTKMFARRTCRDHAAEFAHSALRGCSA